MLIYSKNGKQIFPRAGMIVQAGSMVKDGGEFKTLEKDCIIKPIRDYVDDMSSKQKVVGFFLSEMS